MSFLFDTVAIPLWFVLFVIGSAVPLWIKWYRAFHKKFITTGILQKKINKAKTTAELKMDVLKKATENWNANSDNSEFDSFFENREDEHAPSAKPKSKPKSKAKAKKSSIDPEKRKNIKMVLTELANGGETGVLAKTVSDTTGIATVDITHAMNYLIEKKYAELIDSTKGKKYYLTEMGKKYCINKKILPR